jgi:hypothetical protein
MTTTINKTNGSVLTSVADGAVDIGSTNIALIGRLYRNYGELINENFVKLLENFANTSSPSTPMVGQLWYDTSDKKLKIFRTTGFVPLGVNTTSSNEPSNPVIGDFWYDSVDVQLKNWSGSSWVAIAPSYTASQGKSGAFATNVADTLSGNHVTVMVYQGGQVVTTFSNDAEYIPSIAITGFTSIKKGITLSNLSGHKLHGTVTDAELLNGFDGTEFVRSNASDTSTGTLTIENAQPLILGANNDLEINVSSTQVDFAKVTSGPIRFYTGGTDLVLQLNDNQQIVAESGSSVTPSIVTNGDTNTGIHWPSADTLSISAGGTTRLSVNTTGASVVGTLTATALDSSSLLATTGSIGVLTTTTVSGTPTFSNAVTFSTNISVNGNTTLGNTAADTVTINADTVNIPNGIDFTVGSVAISTGGLAVAGAFVAGDSITTNNDLYVTDELLVQYNAGTGVSALRVDNVGRILVNVDGAAVAATNAGDATFGDFAHIYAANTAKWWCVWKDDSNGALFEFLGEHHVDSITRESNAGEYKINLDYNMTAASYWSVVGMGAYGNMNMLEFPVGGAYVRVKNEIYDYTGTRGSSYNSVVSFGI